MTPFRTRCLLLLGVGVLLISSSAKSAERFYPLLPCRLLDTRTGQGGGALLSGEVRGLAVIGGPCGIPTGATAAAMNFAAVGPASGSGFLTIFPYGTPLPVASTLNFAQGTVVLANGTIAGLTAGTSNISASFNFGGGGAMNLIIDVTGYFAP